MKKAFSRYCGSSFGSGCGHRKVTALTSEGAMLPEDGWEVVKTTFNGFVNLEDVLPPPEAEFVLIDEVGIDGDSYPDRLFRRKGAAWQEIILVADRPDWARTRRRRLYLNGMASYETWEKEVSYDKWVPCDPLTDEGPRMRHLNKEARPFDHEVAKGFFADGRLAALAQASFAFIRSGEGLNYKLSWFRKESGKWVAIKGNPKFSTTWQVVTEYTNSRKWVVSKRVYRFERKWEGFIEERGDYPDWLS